VREGHCPPEGTRKEEEQTERAVENSLDERNPRSGRLDRKGEAFASIAQTVLESNTGLGIVLKWGLDQEGSKGTGSLMQGQTGRGEKKACLVHGNKEERKRGSGGESNAVRQHERKRVPIFLRKPPGEKAPFSSPLTIVKRGVRPEARGRTRPKRERLSVRQGWGRATGARRCMENRKTCRGPCHTFLAEGVNSRGMTIVEGRSPAGLG